VLKSSWLLALGTVVLAALGAYFLIRQPDHSAPPRGGKQPTGNFRDMAAECGLDFRMAFLPSEQGENFKINLYDHGCGVAVADFDGDGYEDIYFVNQLGPNALYRNRGDGTFVNVSENAGVAVGDRICVGAAFGDIDNDGYPDLFVTSIRGGNILFRNLGNGKFKDVTKEAGLTWIGHSQTAAFFDYDKDGFLDLMLTNTANWTFPDREPAAFYYPGVKNLWGLAASPKEYNVLYRNNGDGTFTNVTDKAGVKGQGWGGDVAIFDYDEDGNLDMLITNMFGRSQLWRNNGNGTFSDVTRAVLGRTSFGAIGSKAFDFNNDGKLDLIIVDMHSDMWTGFVLGMTPPELQLSEKKKFAKLSGPMELASFEGLAGEKLEQKLVDVFQVRYDEVLFGNTLFKNVGGGKFTEISEQAGVETFWPWGVATGDFNNDGFEDVFLPSGMGYPFFYWGNRLLMNNGNETCSERSRQDGIEPPRHGIYLAEKIGGESASRSSRCAATADFRKIGRLDIVTNNFNDSPYFFQNHFPRKNFITFQLQGTKSNRDAVGALVTAHLGKEVLVRQVPAAGGYLSQSSKNLHFGLGNRERVDRVEIRWPSGKHQEILNPAINQWHRVVEPR